MVVGRGIQGSTQLLVVVALRTEVQRFELTSMEKQTGEVQCFELSFNLLLTTKLMLLVHMCWSYIRILTCISWDGIFVYCVILLSYLELVEYCWIVIISHLRLPLHGGCVVGKYVVALNC